MPACYRLRQYDVKISGGFEPTTCTRTFWSVALRRWNGDDSFGVVRVAAAPFFNPSTDDAGLRSSDRLWGLLPSVSRVVDMEGERLSRDGTFPVDLLHRVSHCFSSSIARSLHGVYHEMYRMLATHAAAVPRCDQYNHVYFGTDCTRWSKH